MLSQLESIKLVDDKVIDCIDIANDHYGTFLKIPTIKFNLTSARVAGTANYSKWLLRFHLGYLEENIEEYINQIIPHEVAHLVARNMGSCTPHSHYWKSVMRVFGLIPKRTHNMTIPVGYGRKDMAIYAYACACTTHDLTIIRHKRIQKGQSYSCRKCNNKLKKV